MRFVSKYREFRLVKSPSDRIIDDQRRVTIIKGETIEFKNFQYNTEEPETIEWLMNHPERGVTFDVVKEDEEQLLKIPVQPIVSGPVTTINKEAKPDEVKVENPNTLKNLDDIIAEKVAAAVTAASESILKTVVDLIHSKGGDIHFKEKKRPSFKCSICGKEFISGFEVSKHKQKEHPKPEPPKNE